MTAVYAGEVGRHRHGDAADRGLQAQARAKLAEVEERSADLVGIRTTLVDALEARCSDLKTCAASDRCPLPFADIATTRWSSVAGTSARREL